MEINLVKQVDPLKHLSTSKNNRYLLCASGYESRCTFFTKQTIDCSFNERIVFGVESFHEDIQRIENDRFYSSLGLKIIATAENNGKNLIREIVRIVAQDITHTELFIDYSSMPRTWYSEVINYLREINPPKKLTVIFVYSEGKFVKSSISGDSYNMYVEPLIGFTHLDVPENPTALIIGLGYETRRPLGLKEYFDANKVILFMTDKITAPDYYKEVVEKNSELINLVNQKSPDDIFTYPVYDQEYTFWELESICNSLLSNYRVVIAPCGPKFFTLCSLLVSKKNNKVDVWRISPGDQRKPYDRAASGEILALKVTFK